jgi:hypothetical protein
VGVQAVRSEEEGCKLQTIINFSMEKGVLFTI